METISNYLSKMQPFQQLCAALLLVFAGCGAGYTASEANVMQPEEVQTFDVFSDKAIEVNEFMSRTLETPTDDCLRTANNHLAIGLQNWADRNQGANKGLFVEYIAACRLVIDEAQAGHDITDETKEMNRLYGMLNPEE